MNNRYLSILLVALFLTPASLWAEGFEGLKLRKYHYQRRDAFYIQPALQMQSTKSICAVGGTVGFYGSNINVEGTYLHGLEKSETILWKMADPSDTSSPLEYTYRPTVGMGKIGYGFVIGTRFRLTPQVGAGCLWINGTGDHGRSKAYNLLGSGTIRMELAVCRWLNIVVAPEYTFTISESENYTPIRKVSSKITRWGKGFCCNFGLAVFW